MEFALFWNSGKRVNMYVSENPTEAVLKLMEEGYGYTVSVNSISRNSKVFTIIRKDSEEDIYSWLPIEKG